MASPARSFQGASMRQGALGRGHFALGARIDRDRDVDARMAGEQVEHMVEEADPGGSTAHAGAVEVDRNLDVGLLGLALDRRLAHPLGFRSWLSLGLRTPPS